jgi:hypothetical protein
MALKRSTDRKVTPSATAKGAPRIANAFGLPSGAAYSCPGQTAVCGKVCYAGKLERIYKGTLALLMHNWALLNGADVSTMVELLRTMMTEFVTEADRKSIDKIFRIHWDGDFFSIDYARAWATVVAEFPDVQFWAYTRSFIPTINVVPVLAGIPNLTLYLSIDTDNSMHAAAALIGHPGVRVATLAQTAELAQGLVESTTGKSIVPCPEVMGKLPLVSNGKGACATCALCVVGRKDVAFSISKR